MWKPIVRRASRGRCPPICSRNFARIVGTATPLRGRSERERAMSRGVKVQIFGQSYTIMGDLDEAYVQQLAAYVDAKMQAITGMTSTVDTQKAAVLAALAIADELHSSRKEKGEREELLKEQAERCLTLVERALKQTE